MSTCPLVSPYFFVANCLCKRFIVGVVGVVGVELEKRGEMNNHNYDNNGAPYFSTNLNLHQQQSAPPPAPFFPPQQQHFNSNNSFQNPGMGGGNGFWDGNQGNNWNGGNVGRNFDGSGGAGMSGSGGGMVGGGRGNGFNEYGFSVDRFDRNFNGNGNGGNGYNDSGFGDGSGVDVKPKPQRNDEARLNDSAPSLSSPSPMVKHPTGLSSSLLLPSRSYADKIL